MAKFVLDLFTRYQTAFGFVAYNYVDPLLTKKNAHHNKFSGAQVYVKTGYCFSDMEISNGDFNLKLGDPKFFANNSGDTLFVGPPMISVSREKILSITTPDRSEAEIVESFGKKAYEIKIKGIMVDMAEHQYPGKHVKLLRKFNDIEDYMDVTCQLLNDLGIYSIYITQMDELTGVEGFEDTLSYSFTARSAQPAEFILIAK